MTHTSRARTRAALAALALATALVSIPGTAAAEDAPAQPGPARTQSVAADATTGWVRFGHFAPSAEAVDVFVDGQPLASGIGFKTVSDYLRVPAGPHEFELKPSGQDGAPDLLDIQAGVPAGGAVTVSALTTRDGIASQVYDDALTAPPAGQALVRFIHAAPDVPAVDLVVAGGGPTLISGLAYPAATGYQAITPGQYDIEVHPAGSADVLLKIDAWSIQPGSQASIVLVRGADGQLDVAPVVDGAATAVTPVGGVQTGYGGMAPQPSDTTSRLLYLLAAMVATATVLSTCASLRRRRTVVAGR